VINVNMNAATRLGVNSLLLLGGVMALYLGRVIFLPTIIALFLAAMLWPATVWLHQRLHFRWSIACLTMITGLVLLNFLIAFGLVVAVTKMVQALPSPEKGKDQQQQVYDTFRSRLKAVFPLDRDNDFFPEKAEQSRVFEWVSKTLEKSVPEVLVYVGWTGLGWLWQVILILFLLLFLMVEGRMLLRRVAEIIGPSPEARAKAGRVMSDMARQVRTYLVWRTLINFGVALVVGLVYAWAGLSQAWTWAMFTAVLFYIPYLGPIVAGGPPVIDAFLSHESPMLALGILLFYLVMTILEGYVLVPVLMGRSMEMNATTVLLSCLFWELVWGPLGLFLAMPLMAAIKSICYHVPGWRPWANLMSTTEEDPEPEKPALAAGEKGPGGPAPGGNSEKAQAGGSAGTRAGV
jgi:predicted PurR-regulated permease PerM